MKQILKKTMMVYWAMICIPVVFILLLDTNLIESGILAGSEDGGVGEFYAQMAAILLTLLFVPLTLKFFKIGRVASMLKLHPQENYLRLSVVRMLMLELPLVVSLVCYYLYANSSFFHLGLIALASFFFIYPSKGRCLHETETEDWE